MSTRDTEAHEEILLMKWSMNKDKISISQLMKKMLILEIDKLNKSKIIDRNKVGLSKCG